MHCLEAYSFFADIVAQAELVSKLLAFGIGTVWPIVLLVFGLGMLIFVHELGHFVAAKLVGIKVEVFALGFGPRLLGFRRGETDYRISAVPLGGYIKMLGQDDLDPAKRVDDERAFCSKSVSRRFIVIASGVVMNILCALALFIILFRFVGVNFRQPEVGAVMPNSPAETAGILPGDRILEVDGNGVRDFGELALQIAVSDPGKEISLKIQRPGRSKPLQVSAVPTYLSPEDVVQGIGIEPLVWSLQVAEQGDYSGLEGFQNGDRIVGLEFDGKRHYYNNHWDFSEAVNIRRDKPTAIIASRNGRELPPLMLRPHLAPGSRILGLIPPSRVAAVQEKSPAARAGIKPGDVIVSFNKQPWPSYEDIIRTTAGNQYKEVPISVLRAGKRIDLLVTPRDKDHKQGALGIGQELDYQNLFVAGLDQESILAQQDARIPVGAELLKLNGRRLANWSDLIGKLYAQADNKVELEYFFNGQKSQVAFIAPPPDNPVWREEWRFFANLQTKPNEIRVRAKTLAGAVYIGMHKTWFWMQKTYLTFIGLAKGAVKPKALSGPLGIAQLSIDVVQTRGVTYFFYFMAILGVNLAIVNFFPIPFLDGGHALFLFLEKIKGSPVSIRVQTVATMIGMGVLLLLMLFITYQDIIRWLGLI